jgi:hypothetical protein
MSGSACYPLASPAESKGPSHSNYVILHNKTCTGVSDTSLNNEK